MDTSAERKSSPALVAAAWLIVVAPAAWGLTYTVQNALKLFTSPPAATSSTPPPAAAPAH